MKLQNGYKVIYEKAANGERTFYASKSNAYPAVDDVKLASFKDADFAGKVIYEHDGKFYVSKNALPEYDAEGNSMDTLITGFEQVFVADEAAEPAAVVVEEPEVPADETVVDPDVDPTEAE